MGEFEAPNGGNLREEREKRLANVDTHAPEILLTVDYGLVQPLFVRDHPRGAGLWASSGREGGGGDGGGVLGGGRRRW